MALAAALGAGCGGDDESAQTTPDLPKVTVPETIETTPTETQTVAPAPPSTETTPPSANGGTPAPGSDTQTTPPADTPQNDTPPPTDSPAERFEDFCNENPGACG